MDNNSNGIRFEHTPYHNVYLKDRKNIELTGVKRIESFDSLEFLIETSLGFLNIKGTGLGLSIAKHIIIRHQGNLTVNSNGYNGTTFTIYLPVEQEQI